MLKTRLPLKILAIIPGSRYLGEAILYDTELRDWRIKDIRGNGMSKRIEKLKSMLSDFISRYDLQVLAIKKPDPIRSSRNLDALTMKIQSLARTKGLKVCQFTLSEIKASVTAGIRINKKTLAEKMAFQYPELIPDYEKEQRNKNPYFFEAVALV